MHPSPEPTGTLDTEDGMAALDRLPDEGAEEAGPFASDSFDPRLQGKIAKNVLTSTSFVI